MVCVRCRTSNSRTRKTLAAPLRFFALHRHEAHVRSLRCFADRLRISSIVLLPFHERLHVGGRDEPGVMATAALLSFLRKTTPPLASAPWTWNTFFARSNPTVVISDMTASQNGLLRSHLGTSMPSGGGYGIKAPTMSKGSPGHSRDGCAQVGARRTSRWTQPTPSRPRSRRRRSSSRPPSRTSSSSVVSASTSPASRRRSVL